MLVVRGLHFLLENHIWCVKVAGMRLLVKISRCCQMLLVKLAGPQKVSEAIAVLGSAR